MNKEMIQYLGEVVCTRDNQVVFIFGQTAPNEGIGMDLRNRDIVTVHLGAEPRQEDADMESDAMFRKPEGTYPITLGQLTTEETLVLGDCIKAFGVLSRNTITISAKARSGKDRFAGIVQKHTYEQVALTSLGESIYACRECIYGKREKKNRHELLLIGQGLREQDPHIWIKSWLRKAIDAVLDDYTAAFVVTDVRQPNEFQFFTSLGATTVKIFVDTEKRLEMIKSLDGAEALSKAILEDDTEQHSASFVTDHTFRNDYDTAFDAAVHKFLAEYTEQKGLELDYD